MYKYLFILVLTIIRIEGDTLPGEEWVSRAQLVNPVDYFSKMMQELMYEVERRGWSSLRMADINQNLDTLIANWHVNGTVTYTNGFIKSIQKIDLSTVSSSFSRIIENNVTVIPTAAVNGRLHFRDINIGYDVITDLAGFGEQRYTGEILCNNAAFDFRIAKNVITEAITVSSDVQTIQGPSIRMIYLPANHITEVLSRNFASSDNWDGMSLWTTTFNSILMDIAVNKVEFPRYCFKNCS